MEFMLLFMVKRGAPGPEPAGFAAMGRLAAELASQGKLRRGAPLESDSAAARVRVRDGKAVVSDGPFAETKEVVAGFWIVDAADRAEAIEIARRTPHARGGVVEVHAVQFRETAPDPATGTPFMMVFGREPGLTDPDGAKLREMLDFSEALKREKKLFETAPLAADPPPARVESRAGATLVTDGPFAESKEAVGGYSLVRMSSRAAAVDLAKRYPHAKWGPVEVREVLFFDRT
jgi:hypothetical protein